MMYSIMVINHKPKKGGGGTQNGIYSKREWFFSVAEVHIDISALDFSKLQQGYAVNLSFKK